MPSLKQADICNFLAELALESGDLGLARGQAEKARELALCDGPPHCYKSALDLANQMVEQTK